MKLLRLVCSLILALLISPMFESCSSNIGVDGCSVPKNGYGVVVPKNSIRDFIISDSIIYIAYRGTDLYYMINLRNQSKSVFCQFNTVFDLLKNNIPTSNRLFYSLYLKNKIDDSSFLFTYTFKLLNNDTIIYDNRFDIIVYNYKNNTILDIPKPETYQNIGFGDGIIVGIDKSESINEPSFFIFTNDEFERIKFNSTKPIVFKTNPYNKMVEMNPDDIFFKSGKGNIIINQYHTREARYILNNLDNGLKFNRKDFDNIGRKFNEFAISENDSLFATISISNSSNYYTIYLLVINLVTKEATKIDLPKEYCLYMNNEINIGFLNKEEVIFNAADVNERIEDLYKFNLRTKVMTKLNLNNP